jgi:hypothetical protein
MSPFDQHFPDCAGAERLVLHIQEKGLSLPPGEYGFFEWYCEDPKCDCRRALLQVISPQRPGEILATINFGWESAAFYDKQMPWEKDAGREITSASLDPLNPNSELAEALLEGFRDYIRHDSFYPQQLRRHYEMFKSTQTPMPNDPAPPALMDNLTPDAILRQLQHVPDKCDFAPYEAALLAAAMHREALTPELIAALDRVSADPAHYLKHQDECLHLFAIYLLAQFRETRALDAFLRFFSLSGEQALDLTGDMVTENGAAVLASVCGGDPAPLLRLIHDETVNEFVRGQAIDGLAVQCVWGERPRPDVIADLRALFSTLPKPGDANVWAHLVGAVNDFNAFELLPEVRQAFAENLVDDTVIGLEDIDPAAKREPRGYPTPSPEEEYRWFCERNAPIDAVNECSSWLCFRDDDENGEAWDDEDDFDREDWRDDIIDLPPPELAEYIPPQPYIAPPKVGRNDPCPCGSGKKYKKCCGK